MKKIYTIILVIAAALVHAQPVIQWQNTIGGNANDLLYTIQQTADGGYVLGGSSSSNISGDKTENSMGQNDYWLVKTDSSGSIQLQNTIGGSSSDNIAAVWQTREGGYILGGSSVSQISGDKTEGSCGGVGSDYWIVKTDAAGSILWQNTIGAWYNEFLTCIRQTADGGYIVGGRSDSPVSCDKTEPYFIGGNVDDYWIVKTDSLGNVLWDNVIGGTAADLLYDIIQTADGGYLLAGASSSGISVDKTENSLGGNDYWIVKTDSLGNNLWDNTIGGSGNDILTSVQQTSDGGYILGGYSNSTISGDKTEDSLGGNDFWVVKTDAAGVIQWQNTIGGNSFDNLRSVHQTADGGYILGGNSGSNISGDKTENSLGGADYWVVKIDSSGNILWDNTIGGSGSDNLYSVRPAADGGYILGGYSGSNISGDKTENSMGQNDYWIVKLTPDIPTSISAIAAESAGVLLYPNPATNEVRIKADKLKIQNAEIYDVLGQMQSTRFNSQFNTLDISSLASGIYTVHVRADGNRFVRKLSINK